MSIATRKIRSSALDFNVSMFFHNKLLSQALIKPIYVSVCNAVNTCANLRLSTRIRE